MKRMLKHSYQLDKLSMLSVLKLKFNQQMEKNNIDKQNKETEKLTEKKNYPVGPTPSCTKMPTYS